MREAGYPNGKNFPKLDFYVNSTEGSSIHKTCTAVAEQLKANIGVDLNIVIVSSAEREAAINSGKAKIWRSGWIADYPDPENFLAMFYGPNITEGSAVNSYKFRNAEFDATFEKALLESDLEKRNALYNKCDQMIVDNAAVMPILTDDHIVIVNARVRNFKASPMEEMNLTDVFIKEAKK
jgi:peptide/nickel transport system substrate-binding protein